MLAMKAKVPQVMFGTKSNVKGMVMSRIWSINGKLIRFVNKGDKFFAVTLSEDLINDNDITMETLSFIAGVVDETDYLSRNGKGTIKKGKYAGKQIERTVHTEPVMVDNKEVLLVLEKVNIEGLEPFISVQTYAPQEAVQQDKPKVDSSDIAFDDVE